MLYLVPFEMGISTRFFLLGSRTSKFLIFFNIIFFKERIIFTKLKKQNGHLLVKSAFRPLVRDTVVRGAKFPPLYNSISRGKEWKKREGDGKERKKSPNSRFSTSKFIPHVYTAIWVRTRCTPGIEPSFLLPKLDFSTLSKQPLSTGIALKGGHWSIKTPRPTKCSGIRALTLNWFDLNLFSAPNQFKHHCFSVKKS